MPGVWSVNGGFNEDFASVMGGGFGYSNNGGGIPIYNAIFTADRTTGQILSYFITGLAGIIGGQPVMPFTLGNHTYRKYGGQQEHGNHVHREDGKRYNRDGKEIDGREQPLNRGNDVPGRLKKKFQKGFDDEVTPFTRWLANRSDADLVGMSILGAGIVVGSYYVAPFIAPFIPVAAPALVPLLTP